jgi:hypothetical protein
MEVWEVRAMRRKILTAILAVMVFAASFIGARAVRERAQWVEEDGGTFLVDRTGERWDITQAVSIGFEPDRFQFGLGRDAFFPLNDSFLSDADETVPESLRVIAISEGGEAKAYSVQRLTRHEIANSRISGKPVAVGY